MYLIHFITSFTREYITIIMLLAAKHTVTYYRQTANRYFNNNLLLNIYFFLNAQLILPLTLALFIEQIFLKNN